MRTKTLSQKAIILKKLKSKTRVSISELMDLRTSNHRRIAGVTARISDLRADGWDISNKDEPDKRTKELISTYRLGGRLFYKTKREIQYF